MDWATAAATECGFTSGRIPDARPFAGFGGKRRQRRAQAAKHEAHQARIQRPRVAGIEDAHASADFSHSHAYVCFKRLFELYSKIPVVCETVEFSGVKRVKHGRYTFKLGQEARADARNAHNVNDLFANAIKSGRDEQFRPVVSRLIRV